METNEEKGSSPEGETEKIVENGTRYYTEADLRSIVLQLGVSTMIGIIAGEHPDDSINASVKMLRTTLNYIDRRKGELN